jgi:hypothetical protein
MLFFFPQTHTNMFRPVKTTLPTSYGFIASNHNGSLLASNDTHYSSVHIYRLNGVGEAIGEPAVYCQPLGFNLCSACFVHRGGVDTLLLSDVVHERIIEISTDGLFISHILLPIPCNAIAYCQGKDVIAVCSSNAVALVEYGSAKAAVLFEEGMVPGRVGLVGIAFSPCGLHVVVGDYRNNRVSIFSAVDGAFVQHLTAKDAIVKPQAVVQHQGGYLVLGRMVEHDSKLSVFSVTSDGTTVVLFSFALSNYQNVTHLPTVDAIVVKERGVITLWYPSSRSAWLSACAL